MKRFNPPPVNCREFLSLEEWLLIIVLFYAICHIDKGDFWDLPSNLVLTVYESGFGGVPLQSGDLGSVNSCFWLILYFHVSFNVGCWPFSGDKLPEIHLDEPSCWGCETAVPDVEAITWETFLTSVILFLGILIEWCHMDCYWMGRHDSGQKHWWTVGNELHNITITAPLPFHTAIIRSKGLCLTIKNL